MHSTYSLTFITSTILAAATSLAAQDTPTSPADISIEQRLNDLDQELRILKRKAEIAAEDSAAKAKTSASVTANSKDGFSIKANDGSWKLRFGVLFATDARFFLNDSTNVPLTNNTTPLTNQFLVRYFRPSFQASFGENLNVVLIPDFAGTAAKVVDGFVEAKYIPYATIKAGKFIQPLGLERWQSTSALTFGERALASNLTANRDIGVQISGQTTENEFGYALGIFNGTPDNNDRDGEDTSSGNRSNDGKDVVARISTRPFASAFSDWVNGLELSLSGSFGDESATSSAGSTNLTSKYVSSGQATIFTYANAYAAGHRQRLNPQLKWYSNQYSVLGEWVTSRQALQSTTSSRAGSATNHGWFLTAGWVLTGEKADWKGITPATNLDPANGTWGAVEVVARVHQLDIDDDVFEGSATTRWADPSKSVTRAKAFGIGVNWYWTKNTKLTGAYERTNFDGGDGTTARGEDRQTEHLILSRLQVSF